MEESGWTKPEDAPEVEALPEEGPEDDSEDHEQQGSPTVSETKAAEPSRGMAPASPSTPVSPASPGGTKTFVPFKPEMKTNEDQCSPSVDYSAYDNFDDATASVSTGYEGTSGYRQELNVNEPMDPEDLPAEQDILNIDALFDTALKPEGGIWNNSGGVRRHSAPATPSDLNERFQVRDQDFRFNETWREHVICGSCTSPASKHWSCLNPLQRSVCSGYEESAVWFETSKPKLPALLASLSWNVSPPPLINHWSMLAALQGARSTW